MATLTDIQDDVRAATSISSGVETLCERISEKLHEYIDAQDTTELKSVADQLATNAKVFAKAIIENTPEALPPPRETSASEPKAATPATPASTGTVSSSGSASSKRS